jgi:hypothetical protein
MLYSLFKPFIAQLPKSFDDRTQWIAVVNRKKRTLGIEKMATVLKIPGKVFMVSGANRHANRKRPRENVAFQNLAPRPGLEPGTCGLTVRRSTD